MFFLTKPSRERIQRLIDSCRTAPFNYAEVGQSLGPTPAGYASNHGRVRLGYGEGGEETFIIERLHADDSVWYDLRSFSRPGQPLTTLGYPIARMLQKRFARESPQAMLKAVWEGRGD